MKYDFLELNSQQNQTLYERGFVVTDWLGWLTFFLYLFPRICIFAIITFLFISFGGSIALPYMWITFLIFLIWKLIAFRSIHTIFHTPYGFLLRWKLSSYDEILKYIRSFDFWFSLPNNQELDTGFGIFGGVIYFGFYFLIEIHKEDWIAYLFGLTVLGFLLFWGRKWFILHNPFQPTYQQFIRLGLSIEKSVHQLERRSNNILKNFWENSEDVNFFECKKDFANIAKDFVKIIPQLEKLEAMEKQIQQGNIIDIPKYITYIRNEVAHPLKKVCQFLENQRNALINQEAILSLEQFSNNPLTQNIELQKKRIITLQESLDISIKQLREFLREISW